MRSFNFCDHLIFQIQNKYNVVRTASIHDATSASQKAKAILTETMQDAQLKSGK